MIDSTRQDAEYLSPSESKYCFDLDATEDLSQPRDTKYSQGRLTVDSQSCGRLFCFLFETPGVNGQSHRKLDAVCEVSSF